MMIPTVPILSALQCLHELSIVLWLRLYSCARSASEQRLSGGRRMRLPQPGMGRQNSHQRLVGACKSGTLFLALPQSSPIFPCQASHVVLC